MKMIVISVNLMTLFEHVIDAIEKIYFLKDKWIVNDSSF